MLEVYAAWSPIMADRSTQHLAEHGFRKVGILRAIAHRHVGDRIREARNTVIYSQSSAGIALQHRKIAGEFFDRLTHRAGRAEEL